MNIQWPEKEHHRWSAEKMRHHCRNQPRLAAREGFSIGLHQIRGVSLRVSMLIATENIGNSNVGISNIDHPISYFCDQPTARSDETPNLKN
jgi:hypothetical protein